MTTTTHYYAYDEPYGIHTREMDTGDRIGSLLIFSRQEDRDTWVADDPTRREAVDAREARRVMYQSVAYYIPGHDLDDYGSRRAYSRRAPIDDIIDLFRRYY